MVKVCVDVDYRDPDAVAACVVFREWTDAEPTEQHLQNVQGIQPYVPGQFYLRELPCLLAVLQLVREPIEVVIVDSYVWLKDETHPGLGAHLYEALQRKVPVVGVAKTCFLSAELAVPVARGEESKRPLYVTAAGMAAQEAALCVQRMHGPYRMPTLLKMVDSLCRQG